MKTHNSTEIASLGEFGLIERLTSRLKRRNNNTITAAAAATTGVTYAIVGDLGHGALANFPNGDGIDFKFDELSKKKEDLIEVLGREYVALGVVAPNAFVKITK